jgi:hypothetical protein
MYPNYVVSLIACVLLLISCAPQPLAATDLYAASTGTATALPTSNPVTSSPEPTLEPTNTPIPTPVPLQWPSQLLTKDNANSIQEINRWGRGSVQRIQKLNSKHGEYLVLTPLGVYLYQIASPHKIVFIPDADEFLLSPDEQVLAVSLKNGDVQIWNMDKISLGETFTHLFPEDVTKKIEEQKLLPFLLEGWHFRLTALKLPLGMRMESWNCDALGKLRPMLLSNMTRFHCGKPISVWSFS